MFAMKNLLLYSALLWSCSLPMTSQTWRLDRARLCFDRPEDTGAINVLYSWVRIEEYRVPLSGGQAACIYLRPASYELVVTSTVPYEPGSRNDEACKSKPLKLELAPNENRTFTIWPATKKGSYTCGWRIVPASAPNAISKGNLHP
jgi:hypothetical protein